MAWRTAKALTVTNARKTWDAERSSLVGLPADRAIPLLLERHGRQLYRLARRLSGTRADAEDLVQQTLLQAFCKWDQFKGDAAPTTWLHTIAVRRCERFKRRRVGDPGHLESLDDLLPSKERKVVDLPAQSDGPLDTQLRLEAIETVQRSIARLPTKARMALVLKDIVELPVTDVARVLGVKVATAKTRVHRARLMLRRELANERPHTTVPPLHHANQLCVDVLHARQEALDRGVGFLVPRREVCDRCPGLWASLDLGAGREG